MLTEVAPATEPYTFVNESYCKLCAGFGLDETIINVCENESMNESERCFSLLFLVNIGFSDPNVSYVLNFKV